MSTHIKYIPFTSLKYGETEGVAEDLLTVRANLQQNEDGSYFLHIEKNGEIYCIVMDVCPEHIEEDLQRYWSGLEDGYDFALEHIC